MVQVYVLSGALILGIALAQMINLGSSSSVILFLVDVLLGYIMIQVGQSFILKKRAWKKHLTDYSVAMLAATVPWLLCFAFFYLMFGNWKQMLILSRFAAPTSSGILFAMLIAAGLKRTWFYEKIKDLAIFDDLDTIILLIPLQFLFRGTLFTLTSVVVITTLLMLLACRYMHKLALRVSLVYMLIYSLILVVVLYLLQYLLHVELEILLPGFILGMLLVIPKYFQENKKRTELVLKVLFMFFVGILFPKLHFEQFTFKEFVFDVVVVFILSNLGKCVAFFAYSKQASVKERLALSIGLFPRGELSLGIIALCIELGLHPKAIALAGFSLALNLCFKGVFVQSVVWLLKSKRPVPFEKSH